MVFLCGLLFKEAKYLIHLICCDRNFDNLHINVVIFVSIKHSKNSNFLHKNIIFFQKVSSLVAV